MLVSNSADNNRDQKLVVGSYQSLLHRPRNTEYVTVCHHPPDWLLDQDTVHNNLVSNARLQLFGHKHVQRRERIDDSIRLVAGAVHPDRAERAWTPRYNLVQISLGDQQIDYRIYPRIWHENHTRFGPEYDLEGVPYRQYEFPTDTKSESPSLAILAGSERPSRVITPGFQEETPVFVFDTEMESLMKGAPSLLDSLPPAHRLVARFVDLPAYQRTQIIQRLNLSPAADGLTEFEFRKAVFQRAVSENKLAELWDLVEGAHNDGLPQIQNPFSKA